MYKLLFSLATALVVAVNAAPAPPPPVFQGTFNGQDYQYNELAGYGFVPSDARDKFGDTLGGIGSSAAIDSKSWKKSGDSFTGLLYGLPDRGWNTQGTINFIPRVQKFQIKFTPAPQATVDNPSPPNIQLTYLDTILLKGPDGKFTTGLDPTGTGNFTGFPPVPLATYVGDGFGGSGPGGSAISLDCEGIFLTDDAGFWISDEYGPYVYQFDHDGKMLQAIRPPDAILPLRKGVVNFSANSPPRYDPNLKPSPGNPTQGRQNNQGFEGLTVDPKGENLYVLLQSAAQQEGGSNAATRRYTRFLHYDIKDKKKAPTYLAEYVVPLPQFSSNTKVAAQSEVHYISDTQFLILARDSGAGTAAASTTSLYRHVDVFDISQATNVKGAAHDAFNTSIASASGVLNSDITPAAYFSFIDFNLNTQLNKFGLHNGGLQDNGLLNEKWESLCLVESEEGGKDKTYYLFSLSDNDFITQNGFINFGELQYQDASGFNANNQVLVFKITLPKNSKPLLS